MQRSVAPVDTIRMAIAEHLIGHTRDGARSLLEHEQASWLWTRLRAGFPDAFSCAVMPDHLHLVTPAGGRARFVRVLAMFTARFGVRFDVIMEIANTANIALRMIRYGFHNPLRDSLVTDPYAWRWSTLRDLVGAAYPIWTQAPRVARALGTKPESLLRHVTQSADLRPRRPELAPIAAASMGALHDATAAALRIDSVTEHMLGRQLLVQAAHAVGMPSAAQLGAAVGRSGRTIRRDRARRHPALCRAALSRRRSLAARSGVAVTQESIPSQKSRAKPRLTRHGDQLGSRSATHGATPGSSATRSAQPMTAMWSSAVAIASASFEVISPSCRISIDHSCTPSRSSETASTRAPWVPTRILVPSQSTTTVPMRAGSPLSTTSATT